MIKFIKYDWFDLTLLNLKNIEYNKNYIFKGGLCLISNSVPFCACIAGFSGVNCQFRGVSSVATTTVSYITNPVCSQIKCNNGKFNLKLSFFIQNSNY